MKEFAEFLVKQLVNKPEAISVEDVTEGDFRKLVIRVDKEDMPFIIGKSGKNIKSIRSLIRAKAIKDGVRIGVELAE